MKIIYPLLFVIFFTSSCTFNYSHFPLQGKYSDKPFVGYSEKSEERVWDDLVEVIASVGLDVKMIDRSSGLLVSERVSYVGHSTAEKKGTPVDPDKFIITSRLGTEAALFRPTTLTATWNARISKMDNGTTKILIKLYGIRATFGSAASEQELEAYSLHNFERWLFDAIK